MSVWKFLLRLSVGALLVYFLLHKHELSWHTVIDSMSRIPGWCLAGALAINLAGQALSAYRWGVLSKMGGRPVAFHQVLPVYFGGMFFNICLPTSIGGDLYRVVGLGRKTGSKTAAFASVFMDRNTGLAALLIAGLVGSLVAQTTVRATIWTHLIELPLWPIFVLMGLSYICANVALFNESFYHFVTAIVDKLRLSFVHRKLKPLHDAVINYHLPLTDYIWPMLLSLVYQSSVIALIYLLGTGLGLELSPWVYCSMVTFQAIASLLPITFSGVGVREAIFTAVIVGKLGQDYKDDALALSLVYFFGVVLVSSLIGGVVYLFGGVPKPTTVEIAESAAGGE